MVDEDRNMRVIVFNPSIWRRTDIAWIYVSRDVAGKSIFFKSDKDLSSGLVIDDDVWGDHVLVGFLARDVPGTGLKEYEVIIDDEQEISRWEDSNIIENEFFSVEANPEKGGALKILDKSRNRVFDLMNVLVDEGDVGDEYNYSPPEINDVFESSEIKAEVKRKSNDFISLLRIKFMLPLPSYSTTAQRSSNRINIPVKSYIILCKHVPRIDVKLFLENLAKDHRLRVRFPLDKKVDKISAGSNFHVVERPLARQWRIEEWVEQPVGDIMSGWLDISDNHDGLMIATRGIHEYHVEQKENLLNLHLTLLRAVGRLSRKNVKTRKKGHAGPPLKTPGAQCIRSMVFEYSIIPHGDGGWRKYYRNSISFLEPLLTYWGNIKLKNWMNLAESDSDGLVLSAVKKAENEDGIIVRLYNILDRELNAKINLGFEAGEVYVTNLLEEKISYIGEGRLIRLSVKPHKIVTLLVNPRRVE